MSQFEEQASSSYVKVSILLKGFRSQMCMLIN